MERENVTQSQLPRAEAIDFLVFSHSADLYGAEQSLAEIVAEGVSRGYRLAVVLPREGPLADILRGHGATVFFARLHAWMGPRQGLVFGGVRLLQTVTEVRALRQLIRTLSPQFVVTNTAMLPGPAWAAARQRVNHLWIVRESLRSNTLLRSALPKDLIIRQIARRSAAVGAVSDFVAGQLVAATGAPRGLFRLYPVPRGLRNPSPDIDSGVAATPWAANDLKLLVIGGITPEKGQHEAIEAVSLALKGGASLRLTLVGKGQAKYVAALRKKIDKLGLSDRVRIHPWTDNPVKFYQASDFVIVATNNEAYGRTTAEALVAGTPVIAYGAGGTLEIVAAGGAIVTDEPTVASLADALLLAGGMTSEERSLLRADARRAGLRLLGRETQFSSLLGAATTILPTLRAAGGRDGITKDYPAGG